MLGYLIILFTIIPAIELAILIHVGTYIGVGNTLLIIILTGVGGAYLARIQGFLVLQKIQDNINRGLMPSSELIDGLMILVGGILLLTPGFVTDTIGFILLIPFTRSIIKFYTRKHFESMIKKGEEMHFNIHHQNKSNYDDIDIN